MIFFDEYHIFFHSWAFVCQLRHSSEELGNRLQTPTLIGCKFLMIWNTFYCVSLAWLWSAKPWIMTRFWDRCQTSPKFFLALHVALKKTPHHGVRRFRAVIAWRWPTFTRESALSSAQRRFTVLFGMGRSGATSLWSSGLTCCLAALGYRANSIESN